MDRVGDMKKFRSRVRGVNNKRFMYALFEGDDTVCRTNAWTFQGGVHTGKCYALPSGEKQWGCFWTVTLLLPHRQSLGGKNNRYGLTCRSLYTHTP